VIVITFYIFRVLAKFCSVVYHSYIPFLYIIPIYHSCIPFLYKNSTRLSNSEFEFLINLIGDKISKKDTAFRKDIYIQERLALTLCFDKFYDPSSVHSISINSMPLSQSTPFHNDQNAQQTSQHCRFAPHFKTEASGMKRAEEPKVLSCHVARPDLLRP
jgi:hypothetical protein